MRIESEYDGKSRDVVGAGQQLFNEAGMTAVNAVEIADGDGSAAEIGGKIFEGAEETHDV